MGRYISIIKSVANVMNVTEYTVKTWIKKNKLKSIVSKNEGRLIQIYDLYNFISTNKRYNTLLHRYKSEFSMRSRLLNRLMNRSYTDNTFTVEEVATVMNVTVQTVKRWIHEYKLKAVRDSCHHLVITIHAIKKFLNANKKYHYLIERYISEIKSTSIVLDELLSIEDNVMKVVVTDNIAIDELIMTKMAKYGI